MANNGLNSTTLKLLDKIEGNVSPDRKTLTNTIHIDYTKKKMGYLWQNWQHALIHFNKAVELINEDKWSEYKPLLKDFVGKFQEACALGDTLVNKLIEQRIKEGGETPEKAK